MFRLVGIYFRLRLQRSAGAQGAGCQDHGSRQAVCGSSFSFPILSRSADPDPPQKYEKWNHFRARDAALQVGLCYSPEVGLLVGSVQGSWTGSWFTSSMMSSHAAWTVRVRCTQPEILTWECPRRTFLNRIAPKL